MRNVTDTLHNSAAKAESNVKEAAATVQDAGEHTLERVAKIARAVMSSLGLDEAGAARVLGRLDLETRGQARWAAFGAFTAGTLVGGGIALIVAPTSGRELRLRIRQTLADLRAKPKGVAEEIADKAVAGGRKVVDVVSQWDANARGRGPDGSHS